MVYTHVKHHTYFYEMHTIALAAKLFYVDALFSPCFHLRLGGGLLVHDLPLGALLGERRERAQRAFVSRGGKKAWF